MSKSMTQRLVKLLASDVDFQSRLKPSDQIEVFFSQPDEDDEISANSELLYVSATFGGNTRHLYRFQMEDGTFDYFDEDGPQRKTVPAAQSASQRQVPLRLRRPPAPDPRLFPRCTPASTWPRPTVSDHCRRQRGDGKGGLGQQLRQADDHPPRQRLRNVLQPSEPYRRRHQARRPRAPGSGNRICRRTTGLSTGAHLHYELMVNNRKVDPMRVRLPVGKALKGKELAPSRPRRPASTNFWEKTARVRLSRSPAPSPNKGWNSP